MQRHWKGGKQGQRVSEIGLFRRRANTRYKDEMEAKIFELSQRYPLLCLSSSFCTWQSSCTGSFLLTPCHKKINKAVGLIMNVNKGTLEQKSICYIKVMWKCQCTDEIKLVLALKYSLKFGPLKNGPYPKDEK